MPVVLGICIVAAACSGSPPAPVAETLEERCISILEDAMKNGEGMVRVHAAEALIWNGNSKNIAEIFLPEADTEKLGYRIGVWRVLVQVYWKDPKVRDKYLQRIREAYLDTDAPDRQVALESLAKLKDSTAWTDQISRDCKERTGVFQVIARWAKANSCRLEDEDSLVELLNSQDPAARGIVGYALRHLERVQPSTLSKLQGCYKNQEDSTGYRVYLLSALYALSSRKERLQWKPDLLEHLKSENKDCRYEACGALSYGDKSNIACLEGMLNDSDMDVRVSAAGAILRLWRNPKSWGYR
ncbi:MAG: HEAT repeat domain-containing protein [Armatimonadota bacterium]